MALERVFVMKCVSAQAAATLARVLADASISLTLADQGPDARVQLCVAILACVGALFEPQNAY